ncbi:MAG: cupin domain-containing protein [Actinobacteria bacterium]|nr:cupin domain-containing protein [Actinomycetota bacterium]
MTAPASDDGARALGPLVGDLDRFLAEDLGRRPSLHRAAGDVPVPLTLDDVDELLTRRSLRAPAFRLVQDGASLPRSSYTRTGRIGGVTVSDLPDTGRVLELVARGATLVLQGLHRYWPPVTALCRALEDASSHPVQANAYLTPPGNRGLDVHHDTHDVLALQLAGRKHWVVHEPAVVAPLPSQSWSSDRHEPGPLVLDTELTPGDCLYLPRGTPHAAETVDELSLHLTIGIRAVTWFDVLRRAVDRAAEVPAFREALPAGFADDPSALADELAARLADAAAWLGKVDVPALADEVIAGFRSSQLPRLDGQLRRLLSLDAVDDATVVRRRRDVHVRTVSGDDRVELVLADRTVAFPVAVAPELDELLSGRAVRVGGLDRLDAEGRLVLVRRLVREGVLAAEADAARDRDSDGGDRAGA